MNSQTIDLSRLRNEVKMEDFGYDEESLYQESLSYEIIEDYNEIHG